MGSRSLLQRSQHTHGLAQSSTQIYSLNNYTRSTKFKDSAYTGGPVYCLVMGRMIINITIIRNKGNKQVKCVLWKGMAGMWDELSNGYIKFEIEKLKKQTNKKHLAGVAQWIEHGLRTKGSLVRFPVRAHAWVAGQVPSGGQVRGNHILMFLSLSFSLHSPLYKNK